MSFILSVLTTLCFGFSPNLVVEIDSDLLKPTHTKNEDAPPTISCPANVVADCPHLVPSLTPTASDDNGIVLQTYTLTGATTGSSPATGINDASSENFLSGVTTVTYYVEDAEGGSATCNFTVNITDTQVPLIICPDDISASNDPGNCYATINELGFSTAWDSCSGIVVTRTGIPAGNQFPPGNTVVTWIVTDAAGNSASCTQNVTVTDTEPPTMVCGSNVTANANPGDCDANVTVPPPTITDNCTLASVTNDYNGGGADASGIYPAGTTTVTYTATDVNGFIATCTKDITVINSNGPTITINSASAITLEVCSIFTPPTATANDPCIGDLTASIQVDLSGLDMDAVGTYNVIYNIPGYPSSDEILTVNVEDTTAPIITLIGPDPLTAVDCSTYTELGAVVDDGCLGDIAASSLVITGSVNTAVLGTYTLTYSAVDASGNVAASIIRDVHVVDLNGPDITISLGVDFDFDGIIDTPFYLEACDTFVPPSATVIDPCFGDDYIANLVIDDSLIDNTTLGSYLVSYDATDALGNASMTLYVEVIVIDTTPPVITLIGDNPLTLEACDTYLEPGATATDCITDLTSSIVIDSSTVDTTTLGTYFVTYDVLDANGNATQEIRTVEVVDTIFPTVLCQDISIQLDPSTGTASIIPTDVDNGSTDNCPIILVVSQTDFDCSNIGPNTVTLSATDAGGNTTTCDAVVTVTDLSDNASIVISQSDTLICENDSVTFTATPSNAGSPAYQWQVNGLPISGETGATFISSTLTDGDEITVVITSSLSACALPIISNSLFIAVSDYNPPAEAGPDLANSVCTNTTVTLAANPVTGSGATTKWTVTSGQVSGFSFSDITSPTSTFNGDVGETYILTWSIDNPDPCIDTSDTMTITFVGCNAIDFDGIDDNIAFRDVYNFPADFSIEIWAKTDINSANIQTIFSKRESNNLIDGYDLRVVNNIVSFNWNNGQSISSPHAILTDTWYHIAVTFTGGVYTLYTDGVEMNTSGGSLPIINTVDCILGAMDQKVFAPFNPENYFSGTLDELRIWDVALSQDQIRQTMNQEVKNSHPITSVIDGLIYGDVIPLQLTGLVWSDLNGYYRMNQATDIVSGNLLSNGSSGISGRLRNMVTDQAESAPLPYLSTTDGLFYNASTWLYGNVQQLPNNISIDGSTSIDWNIVRTSHNVIQRNNNLILSGLDIINNQFTVENTVGLGGQSLRVTGYLNINGINTVLRLVDESQLLQDTGSIVEPNGTGKLHRDQQGTTNLYNYNYWTSPVNTGTNTFSIGDVLHDGSTATNPQTILWTAGHDALGTSNPITLSSRWLYSYENYPIDSYADWRRLTPSSILNVGLGFIMKGSGTAAGDQNYVFIGKPNNGDITTPITAGNEALVGNPYPSAIDADEFIADNSSSTLGTLYFWEHYTSNNTHITRDYEGGYSSYNLSGGNPAISPPEVSGLGSSTKLPERYVPISQGFIVKSNASGGTIQFENDQRVFVKEAVTGTNTGSVFIRSSTTGNRNEPPETALIKRLRINFKTPEGATRPLLLAFVPGDLATDGFDYGYDAINIETFPNDLSWMINDTKHIIQGVGEFDEDKRYPLGVFLNTSGQIEISLQALENFENVIDVFVYDAVLDSYTTINPETNYTISLTADDYLNRFYITFTDDNQLLSVDDEISQQSVISYLQNTNEIYINTPHAIAVEKVSLINILGQTLKSWNATNTPMNHEFTIPVKHVAEGAYVIKVETTMGTINKKVIIQY